MSNSLVGEVLNGPHQRQGLFEEEVSGYVSNQLIRHVSVLLDEVLHVVNARQKKTNFTLCKTLMT